MQGLDKFDLRINFIPNGLEKYICFSINNKLSFIHSSQFLSSSLDGLVKNLSNDDFKYLSQKSDKNKLEPDINKKNFMLMSIWAILKSLKKNFWANKSLIVR